MGTTSRDLVGMVSAVSRKVGSGNRNAIMAAATEELGEIATEIAIEEGWKKREASPDGVTGETIDLLICTLDLLYHQMGDKLTTEVFLDMVKKKLDKWEAKCS